MIKRERLAKMLMELGLNEYETRVYLVLVEGGVMTAPQAAKLSRVPAQRVYDVLERLMEKGLVYLAPGDRKRYGAVEPKMGIGAYLDRTKAHLLREHEAKERLARDLSRELGAIYNQGEAGELLEYIQIAKEPHYVGSLFIKLQEEARDRVLGFVKPPYSVGPAENYEPQRRAMQRGVKYFAIYEAGSVNGETGEYIKIGIAMGEKARFAEEVPLKAVVFDGKRVLFSLPDPGRQTYTYFLIDHRHMAKALEVAFWALWERAKTPEEFFGKGLEAEIKKIRAQLGM